MTKPAKPTGNFPVPVNSKKINFSKTNFDRSYIDFHKRFNGAITMNQTDFNNEGFPEGNLHSLDLDSDVFLGTAVLIDFNFILMCLHTLQGLPITAMRNKKVRVVFNNNINAATADNAKPPVTPDQPRPFCFLRGDLQAFSGDGTDKEDFAIVKIEWNKRNGIDDFVLIGKSAVLPPPTFNSSSLLNNEVACLMQYSKIKQVSGTKNLDLFSGHVAKGKVTAVGISVNTSGATSAANRVSADVASRFGSSGSGFYNDNGELVGILGGGLKGTFPTFFFPLDKIYASQNISFGQKAGQVLTDIFNFRKKNGEFTGEGKGKPVP